MQEIIVVQRGDRKVPCMLGPRMSGGKLDFCQGCQAYDKYDIALCLSVDVDCTQNGGEVLAEVKLNVGTRFEAETLNGVKVTNAIVHSIVDWRERPYTVYWTSPLGKHIETYALTDFKKFKFI